MQTVSDILRTTFRYQATIYFYSFTWFNRHIMWSPQMLLWRYAY